MKICAIIPTLNEEKAIKKVIETIPNPLVNKILIVDGNSSDDTVNIAKNCKKPACEIEIMVQHGKGKGKAFQTFLDKFDLDKYDVYVMLDADCTYDPREIRSWWLIIVPTKVIIGVEDYLRDVKKELEPDTAGLILITASVLMAIMTPISGRISDRIEPRLVASVGMSLNCVALFLLIFVDVNTSLWFIILALAVNGLGIGIFASPNTNAIMSSVEQKSLGVAAGTLGTMRTAGMMVSMGIMMILFSLYIGQTEITPVYYPQFLTSARTGFIIFTIFSILGLFFQIIARNADKAFKSFTTNVTRALKKGDKFTAVGFGTFYVTKRAARKGRNPQTGEPITIKASKVPKFKAGKALKDAVKR